MLFAEFPCLKDKKIANKHTKLFGADSGEYANWPLYLFDMTMIIFRRFIEEEVLLEAINEE